MQRLVGPVHFEDLGGDAFERLCFAYLVRCPELITVEWTGQAGSDAGRDIVARAADGTTMIVQCANRGRLSLQKIEQDLEKIADRPVPDRAHFRVIAGGKISAALRAGIAARAAAAGFAQCSVWSGAEFEERLRREALDLLLRFVAGEPFPELPEELRAYAEHSARAMPSGPHIEAYRKRRTLRIGIMVTGALASIATLVLAGTAILGPYVEEPYAVKAAHDLVEVSGKSGRILWTQRVHGKIARAELTMLRGDGRKQVVVGIGEGGSDAGSLLCFDARGKLSWRRDVGAPYNYGGGRGGRLIVGDFQCADLFGRGDRQIVVSARDDQGWYQSRLCIVDRDGALLGAYWHPGTLGPMAIGSEGAELPRRILIGAINNDLGPLVEGDGYVYSVFQLDPRNVAGEAPPYFGQSERGTEVWYGLVSPRNAGFHRLEILDHDADGKNEICIWTGKGHVIYTDFAGRVINRGVSDGVPELGDLQLLRVAKSGAPARREP